MGLRLARRIIVLGIMLGCLISSGCTKNADHSNNNINNNSIMPGIVTPIKTDIPQNTTIPQNSDAPTKANMKEVHNPFFFNTKETKLNYKGVFLFNDLIEKNINLNIKEVAALKSGILYELRFDPVTGIPGERLHLGYFYVRQDKIYRLTPNQEKQLDLNTIEEPPIGSTIVCQYDEIKDVLGKESLGLHSYLDVNGEKREYHSFNNQVSTGYYESFTWEMGKGLIEYKSGYGAERDSITLLSHSNLSNTPSGSKYMK